MRRASSRQHRNPADTTVIIPRSPQGLVALLLPLAEKYP